MKIIIVGANGQLGRSIIRYANSNIKMYTFTKDELDVLNNSLLEKTIKKIQPHYLINCSAYTDVNKAEDEIILSNLLNSELLEHLSFFSNKYNFSLIHFSTDYVFDGKKKNYIEFDIKNPLNQYGLSKSNGEDHIIQISKNFLIIRVSSLFSPFGKNFVKVILKKFKEVNDLKIVNDQFSKPTNAIDLSNFLWNNIINKKLTNINEVFHFCNEYKMLSWYEFAKLIHRIYKKEYKSFVKIIPISSQDYYQIAKRPKYSVLNSNKIESYFNFKLPNLELSLYKTIEMIMKEGF